MDKKPKREWPCPAPGNFPGWGFEPESHAGSWRSQPPNGNRHYVYLNGSFRKNKWRLGVGTLYNCTEYNSLKKAEAAYVCYLLTGSLPTKD